MEPEEVKWDDPHYQCCGCKNNAPHWFGECSGCIRQVGNLRLPDLYELATPSYGTHKILARSVATGIKPKE